MEVVSKSQGTGLNGTILGSEQECQRGGRRGLRGTNGHSLNGMHFTSGNIPRTLHCPWDGLSCPLDTATGELALPHGGAGLPTLGRDGPHGMDLGKPAPYLN